MSIDLLESFGLNSHIPFPIPQRPEGASPVNPIVVEVYNAAEIIAELQQLEQVNFLPQYLTRLMHQLVRRQQEHPFPRPLVEIIGSKSRMAVLSDRLAVAKNLTELITDPPAIFIDERQKLFFYRGVPVILRPVSFTYLLLLARTPAQFVMRDHIYCHLWPGEINYDGSNKPYEKQMSDHKSKLIAEIRKGLTGKTEMATDEMEQLIITRSKVGYMLNVAKESVVILKKKPLLLFAFSFLWRWHDYLSDVLQNLAEVDHFILMLL